MPSRILLGTLGALVALALSLGILYCWLQLVRASKRQLITAAAYILGFGSGVVGFYLKPIGAPATPNSPVAIQLLDAIHSTLQLSLLNVDSANTKGPLLLIARVLMPVATAQVVLEFLLARSREQLVLFRLRWMRRKIIVLGCNDSGKQLARYYAARLHTDVVGVDQGHDATRSNFAFDFPILDESLERDETLDSLHMSRQHHVIISTGDDLRNLNLAARVLERLCLSKDRTDDPPTVTLSMESSAIPRACLFDARLAQHYGRPYLRFLELDQLDARRVFLEFPPHLLCKRGFRANQTNLCHVVISAEGPMLDALVAQAVRSVVYDPTKPLKLTVLSSQAQAFRSRLFLRYPALAPNAPDSSRPIFGSQLPLAEIRFVESSPVQINAAALIDAQAGSPVTAIYVAGSNDTETGLMMSEALKVADRLVGTPEVVACCKDLSPDAFQEKPLPPRIEPLQATLQPLRSRVQLFQLRSWAGSDATTDPDESSDHIAQRLWALYSKRFGEQLRDDEVGDRWRQLAHHEKWWNRYAADHVSIKFALLQDVPQQVPTAEAARLVVDQVFNSQTCDWLARLEHRRYVCERMLDGWLCREGDKKLNDYHLNPTLKNFDELGMDETRKDEAIVLAMATYFDEFAIRLEDLPGRFQARLKELVPSADG